MNTVFFPMLLATLKMSIVVGFAFVSILTAKAAKDYSQTGPQFQKKTLPYYRFYTIWAVGRLVFWAFTIAFLCSTWGGIIYIWLCITLGLSFTSLGTTLASIIGLSVAAIRQFLHILLYCPTVIVASSHYRMSRFYPLWEQLSPARLRFLDSILIGFSLLLYGGALLHLTVARDWPGLILHLGTLSILMALVLSATWTRNPQPVQGKAGSKKHPNILMIGSDTLRADRLGVLGYHRILTPNLDHLAATSSLFTNCYVPCGRTAPSLISMLTGTWPHTHGVRDNFVGDNETTLVVPALPEILARHGYTTVAVSDWCGADLGKFKLGFNHLDLPSDSWNLRFLIRQGPKDLRLFLSLFSRNRFGKYFLPEIYYLGGVPLTTQLGNDARTWLTRLANQREPFLLNVFFSTTHPPFGSEYPYYTLFSNPSYRGESKFGMAHFTDPFDIIRRQGDSRKEFDLDQILDLYDGCVKRFDDEVGKLLGFLKRCGLESNTIVVIYSDHGMEFFEHETWGQGNSIIGDFSVRVPLIIDDPRSTNIRRINNIIRTIDLAPTLLELVGLPVCPSMEGVSLVRTLRGEHSPELAAFAETGIWLTNLPGTPAGHLRYPDLLHLLEVPNPLTGTLATKDEYRKIIVEAKDRMIRMGRWKLTYHPLEKGALYYLFDLETDPTCTIDMSVQYPHIVSQLKEILMVWIENGQNFLPHPKIKRA